MRRKYTLILKRRNIDKNTNKLFEIVFSMNIITEKIIWDKNKIILVSK